MYLKDDPDGAKFFVLVLLILAAILLASCA